MRYKQRVISSKFLRDQVRAAHFCPSPVIYDVSSGEPELARGFLARVDTRRAISSSWNDLSLWESYKTCYATMEQRAEKGQKGEKERGGEEGGVGPSARGYAIRYAVIISRYKFLARSTWAVAFLLLSAADPFYWSAFRSSIMHLMQLGTYPRLNARALSLSLSLSLSSLSPAPPCAAQSIVFHFDILLHGAPASHTTMSV